MTEYCPCRDNNFVCEYNKDDRRKAWVTQYTGNA